jgi:hypothetical protein
MILFVMLSQLLDGYLVGGGEEEVALRALEVIHESVLLLGQDGE